MNSEAKAVFEDAEIDEQILCNEIKKTIISGGRSSLISIPKEMKDYVKHGDEVSFKAILKNNIIEIVILKSLFHFDLHDIKKMLKKYGFTIDLDKKVGDTVIFNAVKDKISLSFTKDLYHAVKPASIVLSLRLVNLGESYENALESIMKIKNPGLTIEPEGDLDVINTLTHPKRYGISMEEGLKILRKEGKQIGLFVSIRFDNQKNTLDEIESYVNKFIKL